MELKHKKKNLIINLYSENNNNIQLRYHFIKHILKLINEQNTKNKIKRIFKELKKQKCRLFEVDNLKNNRLYICNKCINNRNCEKNDIFMKDLIKQISINIIAKENYFFIKNNKGYRHLHVEKELFILSDDKNLMILIKINNEYQLKTIFKVESWRDNYKGLENLDYVINKVLMKVKNKKVKYCIEENWGFYEEDWQKQLLSFY